MTDTCPSCRRSVQIDHRLCRYCTADLGCPNVRVANRPAERSCLARRKAAARRTANKAKAGPEYDRLSELAARSRLVINRNIRQLSEWLESRDELYLNFYKLRKHGRYSVEDEWNLQRISAENTVNPWYFEELVIGAITIDDNGMDYYGAYTIFIREDAIATRSTVFEENPFIFNERHQLTSGKMPPEGYRAAWPDRADLVVAKLGARLAPGASDGELAELVMSRRRDAATCDFVEAHVYGDLRAESIESVKGHRPTERADLRIWRRQCWKLADLGIKMAET